MGLGFRVCRTRIKSRDQADEARQAVNPRRSKYTKPITYGLHDIYIYLYLYNTV